MNTTSFNFLEEMHAIKNSLTNTMELLKAGKTPAKISIEHDRSPGIDCGENLPDAAREIFQADGDWNQANMQEGKNETIVATEDFKTDTSKIDAYKARLEKIKHQNIERFTQQQEETFKSLIKVGEKASEEEQMAIAESYAISSNFLLDSYEAVSRFLVDLGQTIYNIIKEAVQKVKTFFVDAGKRIGNFFKNIFSLTVDSPNLAEA